MTPDEAREVYAYLRGAFGTQLDESQAPMWNDAIADLDFDVARDSVLRFVRESQFLSIAGFLETYRAVHRAAQSREEARALPPAAIPVSEHRRTIWAGAIQVLIGQLPDQDLHDHHRGKAGCPICSAHDHSGGRAACSRCGETAMKHRIADALKVSAARSGLTLPADLENYAR